MALVAVPRHSEEAARRQAAGIGVRLLLEVAATVGAMVTANSSSSSPRVVAEILEGEAMVEEVDAQNVVWGCCCGLLMGEKQKGEL
mmetsp:Transcript_97821/g.174245  ORF Transcript_97821/g.174245 Transcript_97821/m.174245 type:complete len:86 (-) Transcript_97821:6-263(-)